MNKKSFLKGKKMHYILNLISIIFTILIFQNLLFAQEMERVENLKIDKILNSDCKNEKLVILGRIFSYKKFNNLQPYFNFESNLLCLYQNEKWEMLPEFINPLDSNSRIWGSWIKNTGVHFDSIGNIWVSGRSMYKFNGKNWVEYFIDDEYREHRTYMQFTVDKNNNLWITSVVHSQINNLSRGEILKFDGEKFTIILKTKTWISFSPMTLIPSLNIATLSDNKIQVFRLYDYNIETTEEENNGGDELMTFNQDGTFTTMGLKTVLYEENKADLEFGKIYPESDKKIWYSLFNTGLSLYEESQWILFDTTYGLKKRLPVLDIKRLNDSIYFLVSNVSISTITNDYKIMELNRSKLLYNFSYLYPDSYSENTIDLELSRFKDGKLFLNQTNIFTIKDKIWIVYSSGIYVIDLNAVLNYTSIKNDDNNYNNSKFIDLYNEGNLNLIKIEFDRYEIYNLLGIEVLNGENINNFINISSLQNGIFFLKIFNENILRYSIIFIKNN